MIRLVCIVEVADAATVEDAQARLDAFREAVLPSQEHGITIYRASEREADAAIYGDDAPDYLEHPITGLKHRVTPGHVETRAEVLAREAKEEQGQ